MAPPRGQTPLEAIRIVARISMHVLDGQWHSRPDLHGSFPKPRPTERTLDKYLKLLLHIQALERRRGDTTGAQYRFLAWPTWERLCSPGVRIAQENLGIHVREGNTNQTAAIESGIKLLRLKAQGGAADAREGLVTLGLILPDEVGAIQRYQDELTRLFARVEKLLDDPATQEALTELESPLKPHFERVFTDLSNQVPVPRVMSNLRATLEAEGIDLNQYYLEFTARLPELAALFAEVREAVTRVAGIMTAESMLITDSKGVTPREPF